MGVEEVVAIVRVLEKDGLPLSGLKLHVAPAGRLVLSQPRLMVCGEPLTKVAVIIFEPEPPCMAVIPPEEPKEKSKADDDDSSVMDMLSR